VSLRNVLRTWSTNPAFFKLFVGITVASSDFHLKGGIMNFDQFATSFKNPEPTVPCGEMKVETGEPGEVVIAGSMLAVTDTFCCVDVNGVQYEVARGDIVDIETLAPPKAVETAPPEAAEPPAGHDNTA
jgi:hypothetical protein